MWGNRRRASWDTKDYDNAVAEADRQVKERGEVMVVVREAMGRRDPKYTWFGQYGVMTEAEKPVGAIASCIVRPIQKSAAQ